MLKIAIIIGSTRPGRKGEAVGKWTYDIARKCNDAELKNAIDFLYHEWTNKAAGFVAYGGTMGARAVENLRLVMAELQVATVRAQVGLSLFTDFVDFTVFKPAEMQEKNVNAMLDQVIAWSGALRSLRDKGGSH
jgi:NAD(P)H-dependent FMN reductase